MGDLRGTLGDPGEHCRDIGDRWVTQGDPGGHFGGDSEGAVGTPEIPESILGTLGTMGRPWGLWGDPGVTQGDTRDCGDQDRDCGETLV